MLCNRGTSHILMFYQLLTKSCSVVYLRPRTPTQLLFIILADKNLFVLQFAGNNVISRNYDLISMCS